MKKYSIVISIIYILMQVSVVQALPHLQLDIFGGYYDAGTETIMSNGNAFTLYAYLIPDNSTNGPNALLSDTYYISAAVVPKVGPGAAALGSFSFNSVPINATGDMHYGTPPLESYAQLSDPGDLSKHGIFETYFSEFAFKFDQNNKADPYNTAETPGVGPTPDTNGTMYFNAFTVDTSSLAANYFIHFDLYNSLSTPLTEKVCSGSGRYRTCVDVVVGNDNDINSCAPFSHDAQSSNSVPEPNTFMLLGSGLLGLVFFGRRKFRK